MEFLGKVASVLLWFVVTALYWLVVGVCLTVAVHLGTALVDSIAGTNTNAKFKAWRQRMNTARKERRAEKLAAKEEAEQEDTTSWAKA